MGSGAVEVEGRGSVGSPPLLTPPLVSSAWGSQLVIRPCASDNDLTRLVRGWERSIKLSMGKGFNSSLLAQPLVGGGKKRTKARPGTSDYTCVSCIRLHHRTPGPTEPMKFCVFPMLSPDSRSVTSGSSATVVSSVPSGQSQTGHRI